MLLLSHVRAVVFDAVGTLIQPDPPAPEVYAEVGRKFGSRLGSEDVAVCFAAAFAREEEQDRAASLQTSEAREIERWQRIVAQVLADVTDKEACFQELFEHFRRPDAWRCDPDAGPTFAGLADRGLTLGMASNYDSRLRCVLAGLPGLRPIQHLVISSEIGWRKPALQFFSSLCRIVGYPAANVLYVGDDLTNDYEPARLAGLDAVLVDPQGNEQAARRITRLTELLR